MQQHPAKLQIIGIILMLCCISVCEAQDQILEPLVISVARSPRPTENVPFTIHNLSGEDLRAFNSSSLDSALRSIPAFGLFRRSDSQSAAPSSQGLSLRNLGPSAASRSLVLLDGFPVADAFGAWIPWAWLPKETLASVEILEAGGGSVWGNGALGGVLQLRTVPVLGDSASLSASAGDFKAVNIEGQVTRTWGQNSVQLLGSASSSEGFVVSEPGRAGPIDTPVGGSHRWGTGRWRHVFGSGIELLTTARLFDDRRHNGTPYQGSSTAERFFSMELSGEAGQGIPWRSQAYVQSGNYSSTFSSVNPGRSLETPASNQFAVPSTAAGISWTATLVQSASSRTQIGIDLRAVNGETRELTQYLAGNYQRRRVAGGSQLNSGGFVWHEWTLRKNLRISAGSRLDFLEDSNGHRSDFIASSGILLSQTRTSRRTEWDLSPGAGVVWQISEHLKVRSALQRSFRRPTLDELYRPFRLGNVINEPNSSLRTESALNAEIGAEWKTSTFDISAVFFAQRVSNLVSNVTIAQGPALVPWYGLVAAGLTLRQKRNLELVTGHGAEFSAKLKLNDKIALTAGVLASSNEVSRSDSAPALVGRRLPQTALFSSSVGVAIKPTHRFKFAIRMRWLGAQFEDDMNLLRLAPATVCDASCTLSVGRNAELYVSLENAGGKRVQTGMASDGRLTLGAPRSVTAGFRQTW